MGDRPIGLAVDPASQTLYAARPYAGVVAVIDLETQVATAIIPDVSTRELAVDVNSHLVYAGTDAISIIDPAKRAVVDTISIKGVVGGGMAVDPPTNTLFNLSNGNAVTSRSVTHDVRVGGRGSQYVAVDTNGGTAYVTDSLEGTVSVVDFT